MAACARTVQSSASSGTVTQPGCSRTSRPEAIHLPMLRSPTLAARDAVDAVRVGPSRPSRSCTGTACDAAAGRTVGLPAPVDNPSRALPLSRPDPYRDWPTQGRRPTRSGARAAGGVDDLAGHEAGSLAHEERDQV